MARITSPQVYPPIFGQRLKENIFLQEVFPNFTWPVEKFQRVGIPTIIFPSRVPGTTALPHTPNPPDLFRVRQTEAEKKRRWNGVNKD